MTRTRWNLDALSQDHLQDLSRALSDEWQDRRLHDRHGGQEIREHSAWMRDAMARARAVAEGRSAESRAYEAHEQEPHEQERDGQSGVTPTPAPLQQPDDDQDARERQAYRAGLSRGWDEGYRVGRMRERMELEQHAYERDRMETEEEEQESCGCAVCEASGQGWRAIMEEWDKARAGQ